MPAASRVASQLLVTGTAGHRTYVPSTQLDPGMRVRRGGAGLQPDDQLSRITLCSEKTVEHETADETPRLPGSDSESAADCSAEEANRNTRTAIQRSQFLDHIRQWTPPQCELHTDRRTPDERQEGELAREGEPLIRGSTIPPASRQHCRIVA